MKLKDLHSLAEELYIQAKEKHKNKEKKKAREIFLTSELYFTNCIENLSFTMPVLFYKRALVRKYLDSDFNYYFDIMISSTHGVKEAKEIFDSVEFQNKHKDLIESKKILVFELVFKDNVITEYSCVILNSYGFTMDKINLKITRHNNLDAENSDIDLNRKFDDYNYSSIFRALYFRLKLCDLYVCNNVNLNKDIIKKIINSNIISEYFEIKNNFSVMDITTNVKNINYKTLNNSEVFNIIFNNNIEYEENAEIKTLITSECLRYYIRNRTIKL